MKGGGGEETEGINIHPITSGGTGRNDHKKKNALGSVS